MAETGTTDDHRAEDRADGRDRAAGGPASMTRRALGGLRRAVAGADYPPRWVPAARRPRLAPFARPAGALLLVVLCLVTVQYLTDTRHLPIEAAWALALLTASPLPLLVARPLLAWRLTVLGLLFGTFNRVPAEYWPWNPIQIAVAILVLVVVALRVDAAVAVWIGVLTALPVWIFAAPPARAGVTILVAFVLLGGETIRRTRDAQGALAVQTQVSEREQARRAVLEERASIARELHDVVAHHMSLLAVRAETAPYRLADVPDPARAEFAALAQAARDALTDMRRLLGVLRSEGAAPPLAPQPDLAAVADLVEATRRAGMDVHYLSPIAGAEDRPPAPVALAGFRLVQEALANATRHAPGAPVTVQIWPGDRELAVRVHNGPPPAPVAVPVEHGPSGGGHGVAGMRERVALLGGDLIAEPTPGGGFSVAATLPYAGGVPAGPPDGNPHGRADGEPDGEPDGDHEAGEATGEPAGGEGTTR